MAGEIWLSSFQAGVESSYGAGGLTATRKLYFESNSSFMQSVASKDHHFSTGRRDNNLAVTNGPQQPTGKVSLPMSPSEAMELFNITIGAPVTTTPGGGTTTRLHTYKPGSSLPESAAMQWHDGARPWLMQGCYGNTLQIQGSANGDNMVSCDLFAKGMTQTALVGTPSDRVPDFYEGWEAKLYLDLIGATPGTTNIPNTLINWSLSFSNQLGRRFTADNVNAMNKVIIGEIQCTLDLVFEASQAISLTEYNHWMADDVAGRLIRLEFGNNDILEGALKSFVKIDVPCKWSAVDLGQSDSGSRVMGMKATYLYDATLGAGFQLLAQNARTAAWV